MVARAVFKSIYRYRYSNRLPRDRSYARYDYVAFINTTNTRIDAKVKGSRRTPYSVQVTVPLFSDSEKKKLMQAITENPLLLSHLLKRELPHELSEMHKSIALLYFRSNGLISTCNAHVLTGLCLVNILLR